MNNIVDAVNQNGINAIQQAVLARILGGAEANPVMGGVNQAEAPTQDLVSNAMNKQQAVAIPQLMGARASLSGKGGALGGIGDALMNMYNSRIARSENEVAQAQEAAKQKAIAEETQRRENAAIAQEEKIWLRNQEAKKNDPETKLDIEHKQLVNEAARMTIAKRQDAMGGKGNGKAAGSEVTAFMDKYTTFNDDGTTSTDLRGIAAEAKAGNPIAKSIIVDYNRAKVAQDAKNKGKDEETTSLEKIINIKNAAAKDDRPLTAEETQLINKLSQKVPGGLPQSNAPASGTSYDDALSNALAKPKVTENVVGQTGNQKLVQDASGVIRIQPQVPQEQQYRINPIPNAPTFNPNR